LRRRLLRDQLAWQLIVELGDEHRGNYNFPPYGSRNGGTGRRSGLKIRRSQGHESSILSSGTKHPKTLVRKDKPFAQCKNCPAARRGCWTLRGAGRTLSAAFD